MGRTRRDADEGVLRDCEHGGPAASASYPRLGGGYAVRGVMGQLVSYRGSSVRGRRYTRLCSAEIGSDTRWSLVRSAFSFS